MAVPKGWTPVLALMVLLVVAYKAADELWSGEEGESQRLQTAEARLKSVSVLRADLARARDELDTLTSELAEKAAAEVSLDDLPFGPHILQKWLRFPETEKEIESFSLPETIRAPEGRSAIRLARSFGWPDEWNARQRPEIFFLGPPLSGTRRLASCFRFALTGDPKRRPYPLAQMRWPLQFTKPEGEPLVALSPPLQDYRMWNRTGFRRWDPPKEWWAYPVMGRYDNLPSGALQKTRFPPVEAQSRNWVVSDATPDQLMIPEAAEAAHHDMKGSPYEPRFVVMQRHPVDRAFAHFLEFTRLRKALGWEEEKQLVFARKLEEQQAKLRRIDICEMMLQRPEEIMRDINKVRMALGSCMYDPDDEEQPMYLPFGFAALGITYWRSLFPKSQFHVLASTALDGMDASKVISFLTKTTDLKRMHSRCPEASHWRLPYCTGQWRYDNAINSCSPEEGKQEELVNKGGEKYTRGSDESLKEHYIMADRWVILFAVALKDMNVTEYRP